LAQFQVRYADGCVLEVDVTSWKTDRTWVLGVPFGRTYCNVHGKLFFGIQINYDLSEMFMAF
jgi:hypothetical protein